MRGDSGSGCVFVVELLVVKRVCFLFVFGELVCVLKMVSVFREMKLVGLLFSVGVKLLLILLIC